MFIRQKGRPCAGGHEQSRRGNTNVPPLAAASVFRFIILNLSFRLCRRAASGWLHRLVRRSGVLWRALNYQPHVHAHAVIRQPSTALCSARVIKPVLLSNCPLSLYLKLVGTTTYA